MTNSFSIGEAIRFGWHTVKSHSALVFQIVLTLLAIQVASSIVQRVLAGSALGIIASIVLFVANVFLGTGAMYIALKLARHEHAVYKNIWPEWQLVWRYFWSGILAGFATFVPVAIGAVLAVITGLATLGNFISFSEGQTPEFGTSGVVGVVILIVIAVLTIVAAVYVALRYSMSRFEVIDGARIVDSLRKSAVITRGIKWKLLGFGVVLVLLNILGAIVFLVGLLVTIPISMIASAHVYNKIRAHHHAS